MQMDEQREPSNKFFLDPGGYQPVSVGSRLRQIRTEQGYSIKALAEKSGLAINTLSLIENHRSSPSVNTLERLAYALQVPLTLFFEPVQKQPALVHTRSGERRAMNLDGIRVEDCGIDIQKHPLHPFFVTLPPGKGGCDDMVQHQGYEFVWCVSGEIDYCVEDAHFTLQAGDSLFFDASRPHSWVNQHPDPATYLLLLIPGEEEELLGQIHFGSSDSSS